MTAPDDDDDQIEWTHEQAQAVVDMLPRKPTQAMHLLVSVTAAFAVEFGVDLDALTKALTDAYREHDELDDDDIDRAGDCVVVKRRLN